MNWLVRNSIKDLFGVPIENSEMIDSDYQEKLKSKTRNKFKIELNQHK